MSQLTLILQDIEAGDRAAAEQLLPLVYRELRELAEHRLSRERPGQTLQATALVHEAYLRLVGPDPEARPSWESLGHFFGAAAEAMRRILIDRARSKRAVKHGGGLHRVSLDPTLLMLDDVPAEILDLDEALSELARVDPEKAELVKLRFFAGLTLKQAAAALKVPATTADRHWAFARAWLYDRLEGGATST